MDRDTRRFVFGGAVGLGAALAAHYGLVNHHRHLRESDERERNPVAPPLRNSPAGQPAATDPADKEH
jgi:hypothetical protein